MTQCSLGAPSHFPVSVSYVWLISSFDIDRVWCPCCLVGVRVLGLNTPRTCIQTTLSHHHHHTTTTTSTTTPHRPALKLTRSATVEGGDARHVFPLKIFFFPKWCQNIIWIRERAIVKVGRFDIPLNNYILLKDLACLVAQEAWHQRFHNSFPSLMSVLYYLCLHSTVPV